jgi:ketosteroid isomerase-like protein
MTREQNKQIAHRAFGALMAGDLTPLGDLLAPDAVLHQCGFLDPIPARSILGGEFPGRSLLEDRRVHLERIIGEGNLVALHWRTTGRYRDPHSPELDGTEISFPSMTFIRFEVGKIAEIWNMQDTATMHAQLHSAAEPVGTG